MANRYFRLNENDEIVYAFTDYHETPEQDDILYQENQDNHWFFPVQCQKGYYRYKWIDDELYEKTEQELMAECQCNDIKVDLMGHDSGLVRLPEDLIDALHNNPDIPFTRSDLLQVAQDKLQARKDKRGEL